MAIIGKAGAFCELPKFVSLEELRWNYHTTPHHSATMTALFEQPRNAGTLCTQLPIPQSPRNANNFPVLGGTKISGSDIRDQNGTLQCGSSGVTASNRLRSSRDPSYCKCRQELFRSQRSGQNDGGRHRSMTKAVSMKAPANHS